MLAMHYDVSQEAARRQRDALNQAAHRSLLRQASRADQVRGRGEARSLFARLQAHARSLGIRIGGSQPVRAS